MIRTQLYLDEDLYKVLKDVAARRRKTISELVREALKKVYGTNDVARRLAAINGAFGIWKGREDLGATEDYVRSLRKETRRKRWKG